MKKLLSLMLALVMVLSLTACGGGKEEPAPEKEPEKTEQPAEETKTGGKLVVYSALNEDNTIAIAKRFKEDTGIEIEYISLGGGDAVARVQAEMGSPKADILVGGSVDLYGSLSDAGAFEAYDSPNNDTLDERFNDPNHFWQGWYMGVLSIIVNEERFEKELAPKGVKMPETWDDLLDPAYKDVFVWANPTTAGGAYIATACDLAKIACDADHRYYASSMAYYDNDMLAAAERRQYRRDVQMVFQDAVGSLNPRMTIRQALNEILKKSLGGVRGRQEEEETTLGGVRGRQSPRSLSHTPESLLSLVGLSKAVLDQYPRELSGGQCQRASFARALAVNPKVLVADEPVSALDVSVQARILNLMRDLRRELGLAILLIAHDLSVVRNVCDRVCVMHRGLFEDAGPAEEVFDHPQSDYTKNLLAAVPDVRRSLAARTPR